MTRPTTLSALQLHLRCRLFTANVDHLALAANRAAICSNSVDLPAPGGPPTSVRLPGTIPPPSDRVELRHPDA